MKTLLRTIQHTNKTGVFDIKVFHDTDSGFIVEARTEDNESIDEECVDLEAADGLQAYHGELPYSEAIETLKKRLDAKEK